MAVECVLGRAVEGQLVDGAARRAHDRRIGQRPGAQARGEAGIELENRVHQQDRPQGRGAQHHRQYHQLERAAVEAAEELRPALETHGIDEQHEKYRLEHVRYFQADLPDDQPHQQGAGDRTQVKTADVHPSQPYPQGNGQEHRHLGVGTQCVDNEIDHERITPAPVA
ncbi:hypothetical protein D9M71_606780 [compost metagenome]